MPERFLYEELDVLSQYGMLTKNVPDSVKSNLSPSYVLRPYQIEAFARFFHCFEKEFPNKKLPLHLLFNMATGSGKTLIMAGLILYFYEQGYHNFLFFVNSTNIIQKTKDNFLNQASIKYLFSPEINIESRRVNIVSVDNFEAVNQNDINICFTTIQKLHSDLNNEKENSLTFDDFRKHKVVLIADEAHHINVKTKAQTEMFESWEDTVEKIFNQNPQNLLLEFTATHDYGLPAMVEKYRNKVIYRYDLLQYRNDGYSKDVEIVHNDFDQDDRMLQAVVLSQYKQEVAAKNRINLKPVILFKAQRTIAQSEENKDGFHKLINNISTKHIAQIRKSNISWIQQAFKFFGENNISDEQLVERIKHHFHEDFCLSVNVESEKERYQILLNTLEDKKNRIRAIFAVQKLNEGWDVLNLFDIVRCYEERDTGRAKIGKTTVSEAQLIGRGARYFPFVTPDNEDRFRRKFDSDLENELRVLEVLHYHSKYDSRYIAEIRQALVQQGMLDEKQVVKELKLKDSFKKSPFYKESVIWLNTRRPKDYGRVHSFADLGVKKRNFVHTVATGRGGTTVAMADNNGNTIASGATTAIDVRVSDIDRNIIKSAIARNPFFTFSSLKRYFPNLSSMSEFVGSDDYLAGLEITFKGDIKNLSENRIERLLAVIDLLGQIETEVRKEIAEFEGSSEFQSHQIHAIFHDKMLKFDANNLRAKSDPDIEALIADSEWYAFDGLFGTSEEKRFLEFLSRQIQTLSEEYEEIYLVRNEGHFSIYNFKDGQAFQPDFAFFLKKKDGKMHVYQVFIEPKGGQLQEHDKWKGEFLDEIRTKYKAETLSFGDRMFKLTGVGFYNYEEESNFKQDLLDSLTPELAK